KKQLIGRKKTILTNFFNSQKQFNTELHYGSLSIDTQAKLAAFSIRLLFSFFQTRNTTYFNDLFTVHQNISRILFNLKGHKSKEFQALLTKHKVRAGDIEDFFLSITAAFEQDQHPLSPLFEEYFSHLKKLAKTAILVKTLVHEINLLYGEIAPNLAKSLPHTTNLETRIEKTANLLYLDLARHVSYILYCHLNPENFYAAYDEEKYKTMIEALAGYINAGEAFKTVAPLHSYHKKVMDFLKLIRPLAQARAQSLAIEIPATTEVLCQSLVFKNPQVFLEKIEDIKKKFDDRRIKNQERENELRAEAESLPEPPKKVRKPKKTKQTNKTTQVSATLTPESSEIPLQKKEEKQRDPKWLKTMKNTGNWFTIYNTINAHLIRSAASLRKDKGQVALSTLEEAQRIFIDHASQLDSISNKNFYIYLLISHFEVEALILSTLLKKTTKQIYDINLSIDSTYDAQLLESLSHAFQNTESCMRTIKDYFELNIVNEELIPIHEIFTSTVDNFTSAFENTVKDYKQAHKNLELKIIELDLRRAKAISAMGSEAWKNNPHPKYKYRNLRETLEFLKKASGEQLKNIDETLHVLRSATAQSFSTSTEQKKENSSSYSKYLSESDNTPQQLNTNPQAKKAALPFSEKKMRKSSDRWPPMSQVKILQRPHIAETPELSAPKPSSIESTLSFFNKHTRDYTKRVYNCTNQTEFLNIMDAAHSVFFNKVKGNPDIEQLKNNQRNCYIYSQSNNCLYYFDCVKEELSKLAWMTDLNKKPIWMSWYNSSKWPKEVEPLTDGQLEQFEAVTNHTPPQYEFSKELWEEHLNRPSTPELAP
ncbi:hypothetical protein, partial [Flavobacterium sp.]|uniref:hypothetical protein n=1 Tax=Flavobacterium sp. TaxID=239 RepID=UPI0025B7B439